MSVTKTELIGGNFQDAAGNLLAFGYLRLRLNTDEAVVGVGQIVSGIVIQINLDGNGVVVAGQYVWANDVMTPVNNYYVVTGYTAAGQIAFGPNNQQVVSGGVGGSTFDTGTWIPNVAISWAYPAAYGPTGPTGPTGPIGAIGFGNGATAAVATTLKGSGSGPANPQTVVSYSQVVIGSITYWIPLMQ